MKRLREEGVEVHYKLKYKLTTSRKKMYVRTTVCLSVCIGPGGPWFGV